MTSKFFLSKRCYDVCNTSKLGSGLLVSPFGYFGSYLVVPTPNFPWWLVMITMRRREEGRNYLQIVPSETRKSQRHLREKYLQAK